MKITLITVCFQSSRTIRTTLESVLRQQDVDLDYIVVDGASTDGTVNILEEFQPKFQGRMRWKSEPDRGMYDALNKGIAMAKGDFIGILNADDFFQSDKSLCEIAQGLTAHPEAQVLYGDVRFVPDAKSLEDLRAGRTLRYYSARRWKPWMFQWGVMPPHPSVYIAREAFQKLGGYQVDYKISADFELLVRFLRKAALPTFYLPGARIGMRMGGLSTKDWHSNWTLNREDVRANRENGYFCCFPMMLPKYAFKIWEVIGVRDHV